MNTLFSINIRLILVFAVMGSFLVSVIIGVLNLPVPKQLSVNLITIFLLIVTASTKRAFTLRYPPIYSMLLFFSFLLLIIFYTFLSPSPLASKDKILFYLYLVVTPIFIISLIDYESILKKFSLFLKQLRNFCMFILFIYFLLFNLGFYEGFLESQRVYLIGTDNPIWYSRNIVFMLFVILFVEKVVSNDQSKKNYISVAFTLIAFYLLFSSGSRAPILAVILTWVAFNIRTFSIARNIVYASIFALSLFAVFFMFQSNRVFTTELYSINERLHLFDEALVYIKNNFWGYGIGSFGLLTNGEDIRAYPHNIFIEILFEMGIPGLVIFISLIVACLNSYEKDNIFFYLFLIALISAQTSGDLASNNYLFVFMYLSLLHKKYTLRKNTASRTLR